MFRSKPRVEETFRLAARRRFRAEIERVRLEKQKGGRFPFEGGWKSLEEIEALRDEMVRRDRRIFYQLLALFFLMAAFIVFLTVLTFYILPW